MPLQALLTVLGAQIAALQISDDVEPAEIGVNPPPKATEATPLTALNEASLPPRKRASYRVVSLERPCLLNGSTSS
ncbi:hypothetical protein CLU79DRAFT_840892 [Phycomyces nitens]|nr:hypothetical protein CLU79DRAFT_840892 [Phycomyces nitens]